MTSKYPVGGPREPVYALMRGLGFSESKWSDKFWHSADGFEVSIFGTGSMARIAHNGKAVGECELDELSERIASLRQKEDGPSYSDIVERWQLDVNAGMGED